MHIHNHTYKQNFSQFTKLFTCITAFRFTFVQGGMCGKGLYSHFTKEDAALNWC